jgi:predicted GH43/DUF377 family glycosyl hydrolase
MTAAEHLPTVGILDTGIELRPDPARTVVRFFVPGHEDVGPQDSRAGQIIERILDLDDVDVEEAVVALERRFGRRLPHLPAVLDAHVGLAIHRFDPTPALGDARRRLLGAAFTHEYSIEGAALCNPSIVRHPQQPDTDATAFVLSVRGIGEGHRSSIGFRTGRVTDGGVVTIDATGATAELGTVLPSVHHRSALHARLAERSDDHENAAYVLDSLPPTFDDQQLTGRLLALGEDAATRRHTATTIANLHELATCAYRVEFADQVPLTDRVLWPRSSLERHGMEDARFVEITDRSAPRYCATYTAFDGRDISQSLLTTEDFRVFDVSPMAGAAARGKGLALFPRQVGGRYVALSRADRESNSVAYSDDLRVWEDAHVIQTPRRPWELVQLGNCGSPIETPEGWLVLTHGVGPVRTYSIGAILLDLDEPHRVIGTTTSPIIEPDEHAGYVPNVVYSCGALLVGNRLVLPYGKGDQTIAIAIIELSELLTALRPVGSAGAAHS